MGNSRQTKMKLSSQLILGLALLQSMTACAAPRHKSDSLTELTKDLQAIINARAEAYNCSFSVAVKSPSLRHTLRVASSGVSTESKFAWGSITKMWTGASIMQLVSKGILSLSEPAAPHVDAQLAAMKAMGFPGMQKFSKLSDLYGPDVEIVTIRDLLAMQSGIPDFDTANPSRIGHQMLFPTIVSLDWMPQVLIWTPSEQ